MIELFLVVITLVVACAAWQYIPAFRSVIKWTLLAACVGALCFVAYFKHLSDQDEAANKQFFQRQALEQQIDRSVAQGICEGIGPNGEHWHATSKCPPAKTEQ